MTRLFRLYGKKRGHRMSGWWLAGRVGEAFWFAAVFLLGVLSLSTMVAWQVFSPETHAYPVGYGFWLLVLVSCSFIGIGAVGFIYRVLRVAYSDEHRTVLANQNLPNPQAFTSPGQAPLPPMVPDIQPFTDSPGVKLAFRLPASRPEIRELVLGSIFVLAWNGLTAVLLAVALGRLLRGRSEWVLSSVIAIVFTVIAIWVSKWFFIRFRLATGIGATTVEINQLPLQIGPTYRLQLVQYGRLSMKKLSIALVCEEVATYHFGTDTRTDRDVVYRQLIFEQGRCRIEWGRPLELMCEFKLPTNAMHSFQSPHNAVAWKIEVQGEANRWPSYCRNFPVVVYPSGARQTKELARL